MCCLFGFYDYGGTLSAKQKNRIISALAISSEIRGTDATGIAYRTGTKLCIYKRPFPARWMRFRLPAEVKAVMGHTRMTTQGSEMQNCNNHPFYGVADGNAFALAHNGILSNDKLLRLEKKLPASRIETDSFAIVQLLEQAGTIDLDTLRITSELLRGSFTYTVLDDHERLYIVRGNNPVCLYHFPKQKVYLYASTKEILNYALSSIRKSLHGPVEEVAVREGDILCLLPDGGRSRGTFSVRHLYDLRAYDWPLSGIDTTTPTGKFMLTVFGAVAELEREYILQRQREGIAIAKENGVYKGRKPIVCAGFDSVLMLWRRREITAVEAQKRLGLSPSTFYRKVREYEKQIGKEEET